MFVIGNIWKLWNIMVSWICRCVWLRCNSDKRSRPPLQIVLFSANKHFPLLAYFTCFFGSHKKPIKATSKSQDSHVDRKYFSRFWKHVYWLKHTLLLGYKQLMYKYSVFSLDSFIRYSQSIQKYWSTLYRHQSKSSFKLIKRNTKY